LRGEKERDRQLVPGAEMVTVERGGHFLPLDRPDAVIERLRDFGAIAGLGFTNVLVKVGRTGGI
jgi:hypothetical protein